MPETTRPIFQMQRAFDSLATFVDLTKSLSIVDELQQSNETTKSVELGVCTEATAGPCNVLPRNKCSFEYKMERMVLS